ncbi:hypothetical protein [Asticcacaulis taihuensis]|uniref:hypothetical protein n=1 Tax=Asticcacaulis taihuensis TaxID=260084 RepID=UPI0026ED11FF|nr:hypothetical protein [Asticcacaulis taihuensis]
MARILGLFVGALLAANPYKAPPAQLAGGGLRVLRNDTTELNANAVADVVPLGTFHWETVIDPSSQIANDAFAANTTISVGDATYPAALAAAASVSTAGSRSLVASVDIAKYPMPLWKVLGYASLAAAKLTNSSGCELIATLGASTGTPTFTGTLSWLIKGIEK